MNKIKLFIVEDSVLMQKVLRDMFSSDPEIDVVGMAGTGKDALLNIPRLKPDVVTLDVNLPDMSGLVVLKELVEKLRTRVVMLSAYTQKGAEVTIKALELGALDFIPKPSGEESLDIANYKDKLVAKIKMVAEVPLSKAKLSTSGMGTKDNPEVNKLVLLGASTGGPRVLMEIMRELPPELEAAFLIIQHMPKGFTKSFAERISWCSKIKTKEAEDGDMLMNGAAYVAPSGYHMVIEKATPRKQYCVRLDETPLVNYVRPAVDVTLRSVVDSFEGKVIAVILTGMGKDGCEGAGLVKDRGGKVIVQDEFTSVIYGMPKAVVEAGFADAILPYKSIPNKIMEYLNVG
jgi:two-component system, chemotaxis family, protein-glutamate methylesterase/glutaminase